MPCSLWVLRTGSSLILVGFVANSVAYQYHLEFLTIIRGLRMPAGSWHCQLYWLQFQWVEPFASRIKMKQH